MGMQKVKPSSKKTGLIIKQSWIYVENSSQVEDVEQKDRILKPAPYQPPPSLPRLTTNYACSSSVLA